ncbi:hypothetical protein [Actinomadura sp. 7K507]|uniref:hypothetical protein n=1 Tax=Actinomadura sp. 7K507 TaxID=2530365 RepID=UPI001053B728|nr:hypothetical protein [Actinomadura sp. 7K507]TDC74004.1 hypothetical protein E1285_43910 [Actinomadura sp. 7K507]
MSVGTGAHVLAHGLGGRTDLPLDAVAAIAGGGIAVAASFAVLTAAWKRPRLHPDAGRPLPPALARALDAAALTRAGRVLALACAALVVAVAFAGPPSAEANLAPWALYVTFWVGLVPASVLLGPVWRRVNPLRTLHAALCRATRTSPAGRRALPARLGYRPAAVWLTGFVWLELAAPGRSDPRLVGTLILAYAAANLALAWWFGRDWFTRGDGFEAYSSLLARMSPVGRRGDGELVWRTPLTGLMTGAAEPGLTAAACVLIGSTGFDGITRTTYWRDNVDPSSVPAGTLGLAASIAAVAALYTAALRLSARLTFQDPAALPGRFAATLLPIALGYTVAHYFSFLVLEGQTTFILLNDPFGTGLDLFGAAGNRVDYDLAGPTLTAQVQVNAIVLGHIAGTIAAHDLALRSPRRAPRGQLPIAAAMVALTCAGLFALLSG